MSEKPLLLSSAKVVVVRDTQRSARKWRTAAAAVGVFVVLVGAANITSRVAKSVFGSDAALVSFAPAIAINNPSVLTLLSASTTTATPLIPARLQVPSLGIDAHVEQVGKTANGSMGTPSTFGNVAWYSLGQKPGEPGNAVIDGHVNNALTTTGVFDHLSQIQLGDTVQLSDASGRTLNYIVTQVEELPTGSSTDSIFSTSGPSQLVLITCDGSWVPSAKSFDQRFVVFAQLVQP